MRSLTDVDRTGVRVAVFAGSAVHAHLKTQLKQAEIKTITSGGVRVEWLRSGQVEAIADGAQTLRVLFGPQLAGSRVLEGSAAR